MRVLREETSDDYSPDHSSCEHCGGAISWDEICYTHDSSGFADCGIEFQMTPSQERMFAATGVATNVPMVQSESLAGKHAEPREWYVSA